jgi:formate hydrogenlyase subunit 3/multisubunit Na+/H+ antiporter MnhD subunit
MAVTGAPPFAIFAGELFIMAQLIQIYGWLLAVVLILFLSIAFIAVNYRTGKMLFTGTRGDTSEKSRWETWIPLINLSLSVLVLFMIPYLEQLLTPIP